MPLQFALAAARSFLPRIVLSTTLGLSTGLAWSQVSIQPTLVELSARQRTVAISVALGASAARPMRLQAELLRWTQDARGEAVTTPSDELIVTPAIADLRPGQRQTFRIAFRGSAPPDTELAYRLILEDVGAVPTVDPSRGTAITFRMRYDLPVLIDPAGPPRADLRWTPCDPAPAATSPIGDCIRLANAGSHRVKLQSLRLLGDEWQHEHVLEKPQTVLAGSEREWRLPRSGAALLPIRTVAAVTATGQAVQTTRIDILQAASARHRSAQ